MGCSGVGQRNGREAAELGTSTPAMAVLLALVAVTAVGLVGVVTRGHHLGFEALALVAALGGLGVAFGWHERGRQGVGDPPPPDGDLLVRTRSVLAALDEVEHRHLEIRRDGPTVLVGPTGVVVVSAVTAPGVRAAEGRIDPRRWLELERIVGHVREIAARGDRSIAVRGLAVVPSETTRPRPFSDDETTSVVAVERLEDVVGQGALMPMSSVECVFDRIVQELGPEVLLVGR